MLKSAVLSPDTIVYLRGRIKTLLLCHAFMHTYIIINLFFMSVLTVFAL